MFHLDLPNILSSYSLLHLMPNACQPLMFSPPCIPPFNHFSSMEQRQKSRVKKYRYTYIYLNMIGYRVNRPRQLPNISHMVEAYTAKFLWENCIMTVLWLGTPNSCSYRYTHDGIKTCSLQRACMQAEAGFMHLTCMLKPWSSCVWDHFCLRHNRQCIFFDNCGWCCADAENRAHISIFQKLFCIGDNHWAILEHHLLALPETEHFDIRERDSNCLWEMNLIFSVYSWSSHSWQLCNGHTYNMDK